MATEGVLFFFTGTQRFLDAHLVAPEVERSCVEEILLSFASVVAEVLVDVEELVCGIVEKLLLSLAVDPVWCGSQERAHSSSGLCIDIQLRHSLVAED